MILCPSISTWANWMAGNFFDWPGGVVLPEKVLLVTVGINEKQTAGLIRAGISWDLQTGLNQSARASDSLVFPQSAVTADGQLLFRRIVVQVLPQPPLNFGHAHSFALTVVGDLVAIDLAEAEISRFRMSEVKTAHA